MSDDFKGSLDSKNIKLYLQQIAKFSQLTVDQEKELGRLIQNGDKDALKKMIESNLRFVVSYVKRYKGMGLGLLDLINEGNLGLIEAAKRFDPEGMSSLSHTPSGGSDKPLSMHCPNIPVFTIFPRSFRIRSQR